MPKIKLVSAPDSVDVLLLQDFSSSEQLIDSMMIKSKPKQFTYFGLNINYTNAVSIPVLTRLHKPSLGSLHRYSSFKILINEREKILSNNGRVAQRNELDSLFRSYYLNYGLDPTLSDSPRSAYVTIKWQEGTSLDFVNGVFSDMVNAYYNLLDRNLCELKDFEIVDLKEDYPLIFEFEKYIPPKALEINS